MGSFRGLDRGWEEQTGKASVYTPLDLSEVMEARVSHT